MYARLPIEENRVLHFTVEILLKPPSQMVPGALFD
jgi:hypothetical protein